MRRVTGFTILEITIALAISSIAILALIQTYISVKHTFLIQNTWASVQETGRFITLQLLNDVRHAGAPCNDQQSVKQPAIRHEQQILFIDRCILTGSHANEYLTISYQVRKTSRIDTKGRAVSALYKKMGAGHWQELVAGVAGISIEQLQPTVAINLLLAVANQQIIWPIRALI